MLGEADVRTTLKARIIRAKMNASAVHAVLGQAITNELTGEEMQALRDYAEDLLQAVHEISAYRDVLLSS